MQRQKTGRNPAPLHPDTGTIRRQVLIGLAGIRSRSSHFPGAFLNMDWPHIGDDRVEGTLSVGPQSCNADGGLNLAAFGVLLDTAVAVTTRVTSPAGAHQATVHLHAQFTGEPLAGNLRATAWHDGDTRTSSVRQALLRATVTADGRPVCHATSAFIRMPAHPGIAPPLPVRSRVRVKDLKPLAVEDLDAVESRVLAACEDALRRADSRRTFIEHFWGVVPRPARGGARCDVALGPHYGNRTGVVQGGILFGIAAATAQAAAPRHQRISNLSAWYIGAGRGERLVARSRAIHSGRSFAVVRTEIATPDGARVLEIVSKHTL